MAPFSRTRALLTLLGAVLPGPRSWLSLVLGLTAVGATLFVLQSAWYPWAYSISFGPVLPGTWVGELMPAVGGKHVMFMELRADLSEADDNLSGTVSLCSRGELHKFGLTGRTLNWRGTAFKITSYIVERSDGRGVQLGNSEGEWDGKNEIRVTSHLRLFLIKDGGAISSTARSPDQIALEDTPVVFTLRRDTAQAFTVACRALTP
jgi:hypothetical protein